MEHHIILKVKYFTLTPKSSHISISKTFFEKKNSKHLQLTDFRGENCFQHGIKPVCIILNILKDIYFDIPKKDPLNTLYKYKRWKYVKLLI